MTEEIRAGLSEVVKETALRIEGRAKQLAPVDTGFLRNSIMTNAEGLLTYTVNVGAEYGIHVEYGTYKMSAQPYLRPAVNYAKPHFEKGIMNVLRKRK